MAKENTILAIDVGGNSLKMAEFAELSSGGMALTKYAIEEYGDDYSQGEFLDGFAVTYRRMIQANRFVSKRVRVSISGQAAFSRLSKLPPLAGQREQLAKIIEFEARQTVPYPMDEVAWSYQLIRHTETADGGELPAGSDELEALYVAVKSDLLSIVTDVVQDSGKEILSLEISPTAIFNAAKANQLGEEGCDMILDIGGRSANLVFVEKGRIFVRSIPIAGDALTQQIAKEFNIGFNDAEELKRRHCFIALGGAYEDPDSEVAATISKVARNVMTRLHGEVSRSINLWRSQYSGGKPARMFLCGGSAIIPYTPHFFCEKLRIPVEYLNVFPVLQIGDGVDKEQLAAVAQLFPPLVGLGLRQVANCPVQISLMSKAIKSDETLRRRKPFFYASAVVAVVCMILLLVGLSKSTERYNSLTTKGLDRQTKLDGDAKKVKAAKGELDSNISNYDGAVNYIKARDRWTKVMMELEKVLPDTMWVTYVEPFDKLTPSSNAAGGMGMPGMGMPGMGMPGMGMPGMGMPGMGMPGGGGGQGGAEISGVVLSPVSPIRKMDNVEWIVIEGHAMELGDILPELELQRNLGNSEVFAGGGDEDFVRDYRRATEGGMNLTSFRFRLKLKDPIEQQ